MESKVEIRDEYLQMVYNSGTWNRLYKEEKDRFVKLITSNHITEILKGTRSARWNILNGLYESFLVGVGYKPVDWRD